MTLDEIARTLNEITRTEHERSIAVFENLADHAAAAGDLEYERSYRAQVARMRAMRLPGDPVPAA